MQSRRWSGRGGETEVSNTTGSEEIHSKVGMMDCVKQMMVKEDYTGESWNKRVDRTAIGAPGWRGRRRGRV